MELEKPISIEAARDIVFAHIKPGRVELVNPVDALGRVLAADCVSDIDVTPFDDSAMDGFAVISDDLASATEDAPVCLRCMAHIGAGSFYEPVLGSGECVRIMTGAPLPQGADAVVKIEDVGFSADGSVGDGIVFRAPVKPWKNVRKKGEEARKGEVVLQAGEIIRPAGAGLLASTGNLQVPVYARPVVGLITIGSELVDASEMPGPGMIRDSNRWAIEAYVRAAGGVARIYPRVSDDVDAIKAVYKQAAEECDLVVSTGGACLGDYDLTPDIVADLGELYFTRVDMKPGKSQPFGRIGTTPVFVLSGNPGASSVGFEMYVRPAMRIMQGFKDVAHPVLQAILAEDAPKREPRVFLQRGLIYRGEDGKLACTQLKNQSSALHGSFQRANCLIVIPQGLEGKRRGDMVDCILSGIDESVRDLLG
ncbi:MAG: molybdopterin molybdotransferase MoeA [Coriobacteriales bacterium]|nr:molybdopterin molybdotransferase MoeA [Coriobacteriales bacterium]